MKGMQTVQIQNTELVRDMKTNAVLNTDVDGLHRYRVNRQRILESKKSEQNTKERLSSLEQEIVSLRKIISEITSLKGKG
jgi:hypothetical protein